MNSVGGPVHAHPTDLPTATTAVGAPDSTTTVALNKALHNRCVHNRSGDSARLGLSTAAHLVPGKPKHILSGNGPEFVAKVLRRWMESSGMGPLYIEPGKVWQNGSMGSFHGRLRKELNNRELFLSLE